ncbi:hypothetical protein ACHWQZ_G009577 [Mnemiopsis leidyi]
MPGPLPSPPPFVEKETEDGRSFEQLARLWPTLESITSLENEIPLLHYDVRDTFISERHLKENQAVEKVKSNPKYFYSYAKRFSKQKQSISMLFDEENDICTDPKQIANILQMQLKFIFSNPEAADIIAADFATAATTNRFEKIELNFSEDDILSAIDDIKAESASGPDRIPAVLLKSCILSPVQLLRDLGVTVQSDLSWTAQIKSKQGKAEVCFGIKCVSHPQPNCDVETLQTDGA